MAVVYVTRASDGDGDFPHATLWPDCHTTALCTADGDDNIKMDMEYVGDHARKFKLAGCESESRFYLIFRQKRSESGRTTGNNRGLKLNHSY